MQTHVLKLISRRQALGYFGAAGASMALSGVAFAGPEEVAMRINDITGGAAGEAEGQVGPATARVLRALPLHRGHLAAGRQGPHHPLLTAWGWWGGGV